MLHRNLLVESISAEMSFDDLGSNGPGVSLLPQPTERLPELSMPFCSSCDAPL